MKPNLNEQYLPLISPGTQPNYSCTFLAICFSIIFLLSLFLPTSILAQKTFTVNMTGDESDPNAGQIGDDGVCDVDLNTPGNQCTFRAAIENQNGNRNLGQNMIIFEIPNAPGSGSIILQIGSTGLGPLPPILGSVIISALNNDGRRIELDGTMAGANAIGLQLLGGQCQISFFIINKFSSHGIFISGTPPPGDGSHIIQSNYIGTDGTGTIAKGNGGDGIFIDNTPGNTIGGVGVLRNIISGNTGYGINIKGLDSTQFGTNGASNNLAKGNLIGLDISGENALPNKKDAVILNNAPNNTIGGTNPGEGNKMAGDSTSNGVTVKGSLTEGIKILGNFIGENKTGVKFAVGISASAKPITIEGNFITNIAGVGIDLFANADGSYNIRKNGFEGNMKIGSKLRFADGSTIQVMYQGNLHTGNGMAMDVVESFKGKIDWVVAGDTLRLGQVGSNFIFHAAGNKNFSNGIYDANTGIAFNYVADIPGGVQMALRANGDIYRNNGAEGRKGRVVLKAGTEFSYAVSGSSGVNNGKDGDRIDVFTDANAIATFTSTDNKFAFNGGGGIRWISDGKNLLTVRAFIERDFIDRNTITGIEVTSFLTGKSILNDTVTNNGGPGILVDGNTIAHIEGNLVSGNGTGILVNDAATANIVSNTVTANGKGIALGGTGTGSAISANAIFKNLGLGIDLGNDGPTPNHVGVVAGPNNFQNFPVLTSVNNAGGNTNIQGTLNSTHNTTFRLEFFRNDACNPTGFGEGQAFLDSLNVTTDAGGNVAFKNVLPGITLPAGTAVTATATDPNGNTSEFSACLQAGSVPTADLELTQQADKAQYTVGGQVIFTLSLVNAGPASTGGIVVTDLLPAGITFGHATASAGTYDNTTGKWLVGTLDSNKKATLIITGIVTQPGTITNTAGVTASNVPDPDVPATDNQSSVAIQVHVPTADLELTQKADKVQYTVGGQVIFTISLANTGPASTGGIVVTDLLPAGITFSHATTSAGTYDNTTGKWSVGTLDSSKQATLIITGIVTQPGTITNTAGVTASNVPDPDSPAVDNQSSVSIQVVPQSGIAEQYRLLMLQVTALVNSGKLTSQEGDFLNGLLALSLKLESKGEIKPAIALLKVFIILVKNATHRTHLTNADRKALIRAAQKIIDQLKPMEDHHRKWWEDNNDNGEMNMESSGGKVFMSFSLNGNYPNPFSSFTTISFELADQHKVQLNVYDANGRMVTRLLDKVMQPGIQTVTWQTPDLPAGIYILQLKVDNFTKTYKMMHVKQ
ncbi:putative repeat protein (TIGR01451 family)/predicted secreted protein (Por secretion system target) [Chitinophaga niastensis]|uniref:Putative repeat protein (TIGR01451 family)/predicted secreted protein (Por secretion system target) n=1 Tax=Chitinophaga niastensis TaxID=536980 RepID=A0A2P8HHG3_CHINA|nr:T9SS type A sorting domain-containing protein [Chitinophaga niastensis]PSL45663.1 putative repeat protein (TIGR01451 family)/predicted secreted protein (Por secretion system target) [Chitinophaga niastensis]